MNLPNQDPATVGNPLAGVTFDNILDSPNVTCECGCKTFHQSFVIKKVSQFLTNSGKNELVPMDVFVCDKCGKVMTDLMSSFNGKRLLGEDVKEPEDKKENK